jgi:hypothetical protein
MANTTFTPTGGRQTPLVAMATVSRAQMADTATAVTVIKLPMNAVVIGGFIVVDTAYDTTSTATVTVGDSGSATRYLTATNLKSAARTSFTTVGYVNSGGLDIVMTPTLADTDGTAGSVRIVVEYVIDGRTNENQPN